MVLGVVVFVVDGKVKATGDGFRVVTEEGVDFREEVVVMAIKIIRMKLFPRKNKKRNPTQSGGEVY